MNCRVTVDHTESYLSATRSQPSCSKRVNLSSIPTLTVGQALRLPSFQTGCNRSGCPTNLLKRELDWFFLLARNQFISFDDFGARIPAEDRIVVTWGAKRFSSLMAVSLKR